MITFVLAAILIILATLALLVWPLLFTRNTFSYARHAQNIHYAKERLAELEDQLKNASITATDYEALKLEIETTLADDIDLAKAENSESSTLPRRPNKAAISALCILIPLGAAAVYTYVGTPQALDVVQASESQASQSHGGDQPNAEEINKMVASLEQRLTENPNDLQGWALLSRTNLAMGQYAKAAFGLKKVIELGGGSADIYASLADAMALAAEGNMQGEPTQYADKALELNPDNRQALWLRGLASVQSGNTELAKSNWGKLLVILEDQPEQQAELKQIMTEALGADSIPTALASNQSTESAVVNLSQVTAPNQAQNNNQASQSNTTSSVPNGLTVSIDIAPEVKSNANPQDLVFIFARAVNGPPPPVAVRRIRVQELPITISLSDADAMVPQFKMSLFPDITVSARLSKSGQPVAQSGDYESNTIAAKPGQKDQVNLVIETRVE